MEDDFKVSQKQIDSLLSDISSDSDRFFLVEEKKPKILKDEDKIKDWYKIKKIFDDLEYEEGFLYQNERLLSFIEEIKRRMK